MSKQSDMAAAVLTSWVRDAAGETGHAAVILFREQAGGAGQIEGVIIPHRSPNLRQEIATDLAAGAVPLGMAVVPEPGVGQCHLFAYWADQPADVRQAAERYLTDFAAQVFRMVGFGSDRLQVMAQDPAISAAAFRVMHRKPDAPPA